MNHVEIIFYLQNKESFKFVLSCRGNEHTYIKKTYVQPNIEPPPIFEVDSKYNSMMKLCSIITDVDQRDEENRKKVDN